jgi:cell division protein FtsB
MEEFLAGLPDWVYTTLIALAAFVIAYLNRERLGLGMAQVATREEQEKVIQLQERQIELLKDEVNSLRARVTYLENIVEDYRRGRAVLPAPEE